MVRPPGRPSARKRRTLYSASPARRGLSTGDRMTGAGPRAASALDISAGRAGCAHEAWALHCSGLAARRSRPRRRCRGQLSVRLRDPRRPRDGRWSRLRAPSATSPAPGRRRGTRLAGASLTRVRTAAGGRPSRLASRRNSGGELLSLFCSRASP
jgi:hypothetical protein